MTTRNELRIFISSTFRDLQEEREHLVKRIFPQIRALCRERGITFTEVDLRWGLTHDEGTYGRIIRTCLEEVDRCRPYFIGITGSRYGFIPEYVDIQKDPGLLQSYPWLEDAVLEGMSITEMEIRHGVLNRGAGSGEQGAGGEERARFYFRRERASLDLRQEDDEEHRRLEALKDRIRQSGAPVQEFRDAGSLGEMVYDDLIEIIRRDFADARPLTPLEEERSKHRAFSTSRRHAYIANPAYLKQLNDFAGSVAGVVASSQQPVAGEEKQGEHGPDSNSSLAAGNRLPATPLVIYAESGSGKSSLVAHWCEGLRRRDPDAFIIEHYVGIGARDTDHLGLIRHVMEEIKERFARPEEIPTTPEELERDFGQWLGYAAHELRKQQSVTPASPSPSSRSEAETPMYSDVSPRRTRRGSGRPPFLILALDGLNQLRGSALDLQWIPDVIPSEIRLLLTTTDEAMLAKLKRRGWSEMRMQALTEAEREAVVVRFLSEYHKTLPADAVRQIASDPKCAHPLFLRTLLEELRLHGSHEHLDRALQHLLDATGTEDLFQHVLERMEDDFGTKSVREVMTLLWASRGGLSEEELAELTGVSRLKLATLLLGLDYHLVRREGLLTFFHDYLRRAVEDRYLAKESARMDAHRELARWFERASNDLRDTRELIHALESLGERERLEAALADIERFERLWRAERYEVLRLLANKEIESLVEAYQTAVRRWRERSARSEAREIALLTELARLFESVGAWSEAERLTVERLDLLRVGGDRAGEAMALTALAGLTCKLNRTDEAGEQARTAERIAREVGDRRGIASAVGARGRVHYNRDELNEALACYAEQEQIARELGDRVEVALALGSRGLVYTNRGEYDDALKCFEEQERIAREIGDRQTIGAALGNRGMVYRNREEYDRALECYREKEQIARELGDRIGIANAMSNRGLAHAYKGENEEALACYREQEAIARELNALRSLASAIGNRGRVHRSRGEYDEALECYREHEQIARELKDRRGCAIAIGNRGVLQMLRQEYAEALRCFQEAEAEHRAIDFPYGLTYWLTGTGQVLLELAQGASEMPDYLVEHLPEIAAEAWRETSLQQARAHAEECLALSRELSKPDTIYSSQVLLARIDAAIGDVEAACARLHRLFEITSEERDHAELHYWLWKIGERPDATGSPLRSEDREEALRLYRQLDERSPTHEFKAKIEELSITTVDGVNRSNDEP